jgi:hypothetical protein
LNGFDLTKILVIIFTQLVIDNRKIKNSNSNNTKRELNYFYKVLKIILNLKMKKTYKLSSNKMSIILKNEYKQGSARGIGG